MPTNSISEGELGESATLAMVLSNSEELLLRYQAGPTETSYSHSLTGNSDVSG